MVNFSEGKIPEQKLQDGFPFPKVVYPANNLQKEEMDAVTESIKGEEKAWIQRELHKCGALLFRGFGIKTAADFNAFVEALGWEEQPYDGAAPRNNVVGRVWTANEAPLDQHIFFHHEMALKKSFPSKLFFFCEVAPPEGGATAIVQSNRVARQMEDKFPDLVQQLDTKGILTCLILRKEDNLGFHLGKGWQSAFQTNDPEKVRRKVEDGGDKLQWLADGSANIITGPLPGTRAFQGYGDRKVWFNYIPAATYTNAASNLNKLLYGDGSPIPNSIMEESERVMNEECVDVKWEAGDVLLIDNLAVMHARRPSKPPRRILVAMCK
uniref:TauD/TfdA-like domain-containing protein n=1 Tax=Araucaria cunninghamii TaxID=56994 RepID=A0A0D6R7Y0_ARACU